MPMPFPPRPPGPGAPMPGMPGPTPPGSPLSPRAGRGMDPHEAMMYGMGDISAMAPAPPPPGSPMGPGGLPVGGALPSADPGMDPQMGGSSLLQALNMQLDPYASGPEGHGVLDQPPDINTLLGILALQNAGLAPPPSGLTGEAPPPGQTLGLRNNDFLQ